MSGTRISATQCPARTYRSCSVCLSNCYRYGMSRTDLVYGATQDGATRRAVVPFVGRSGYPSRTRCT
eukprot:1445899-Rhodomonas_salina.1